LGLEGPHQRYLPNVHVQEAPHAGYYYWPRVQIVLDGIAKLLEREWDFVLHLSETDYPVHSLTWIRDALARQRNSNFIPIIKKKCAPLLAEAFQWEDASLKSRVRHPIDSNTDHEDAAPTGRRAVDDDWYWWSIDSAVASCGGRFEPSQVKDARFPAHDLESRGFILAHSTEWVVLTRELAQYATSPGLMHFQRLVALHAGADEIFWPTLVLNIPNFTQKISRQGWYIRWDPSSTGHSPVVLTEAHWKDIVEQREMYLFVRKVDEAASDALLRRIDSETDAESSGLIQVNASSDWDLPLDHRAAGCTHIARPVAPEAPAPLPPPYYAPAPPAVSALSL